MKHYIEELKRQLHEIMERPVTLGRAEEVTVYADTICTLRRMEGHDEAEGFTEEDAKAWTAKMENEDGTTGPHWTFEQCKQVMQQHNMNCDPVEFWVAMNAVYSDFCKVNEKHGIRNIDYYVDAACAFWLEDKDAVKNKEAAYYRYVVRH